MWRHPSVLAHIALSRDCFVFSKIVMFMRMVFVCHFLQCFPNLLKIKILFGPLKCLDPPPSCSHSVEFCGGRSGTVPRKINIYTSLMFLKCKTSACRSCWALIKINRMLWVCACSLTKFEFTGLQVSYILMISLRLSLTSSGTKIDSNSISENKIK